MSEQESIKGKLRKVDLQGKTLNEWAKDYISENYAVFAAPSVYNSWLEMLLSVFYKQFYLFNNEVLFEFVEKEEIDPNYFCFIEDNNDGTYSFYANYYNGGTCLEECLDDEFAKIF